MPPPHDGNEYLPFADMIALEKINEATYRSIALPFSPGGSGRAYGGHVYAQAVWAAAQTVSKGFVVHSVTGYFILAGLTNVPFVYDVQTIRDGRSYCTRTVNVTQAEGKGICFTCTCSFKLPEESTLDAQEDIDLWGKYASVLDGTREEDWPEAPGMDVPWYCKRRLETGHNDPFPGLDSRKVDMTPYNAHISSPFDKRQLLFYRIIEPPSASHTPTDSTNANNNPDTNANLHACAHLYASDRNSLFIVAANLDVGERFTQMASLSHTVVFHVPIADLLMTRPTKELNSHTDNYGHHNDNNNDDNNKNDDRRIWFCKEDWTSRAAGGRGIHQSRIIGPNGKHVASSWQEGVVRVGKDAGEQEASMKRSRAGWRKL